MVGRISATVITSYSIHYTKLYDPAHKGAVSGGHPAGISSPGSRLDSSGALNKPFKIARHVVEPGSRLQFDLPAAQLYTHTPLDMPVEVVNRNNFV